MAILIGDPERLKVHKRKKKPKKDKRKHRYQTIYAVSLNKFNQSNENMKYIERMCHGLQHFFTASSDGKITVCFVTESSAIQFYIKARRRCYRPNEPIQFCWRKKKFQRGDFIELKGQQYEKSTQRMSEFTYR